ncbi:unnamed protein product, partial [Mesorhabditis belari]|uniref:Uncharacterized protein n=1 Tax=Mesorhabditis belari TaxID=2138241 RepID=A0AAF3F527_9BILA
MNCLECGKVNEPNDLYFCEGHLQAGKGANAKLAGQLDQLAIFCSKCYVCGHFSCNGSKKPLLLFDYLNALNDEELENDLLESEREVKQIISQFHQLENFLKEKKLTKQSTKLPDDIKTVLAKINADLASVNACLSATLESILDQNLAEAKTAEVKPVEEPKVATPPMKEESIENVIPAPSEQHYVSKERMQLVLEEPVEEVTATLQKLPNPAFSNQDFNARPVMQPKERHQTSAMSTRSNDGSDDGWGSVKPVEGPKPLQAIAPPQMAANGGLSKTAMISTPNVIGAKSSLWLFYSLSRGHAGNCGDECGAMWRGKKDKAPQPAAAKPNPGEKKLNPNNVDMTDRWVNLGDTAVP